VNPSSREAASQFLRLQLLRHLFVTAMLRDLMILYMQVAISSMPIQLPLLASWMQTVSRFLTVQKYIPVCMVAPASTFMPSTAMATKVSPADLTIFRRFVMVNLLVLSREPRMISPLRKMTISLINL